MNKHIQTFCVHPAEYQPEEGKSIIAPVFPSTTYSYMDGAELVYPGFLTTQNQLRLAQIMTDHERGEWGIVLNSGMAAISVALLACLKAGDHVILSNELYGGTLNFVSEELSGLGISFSLAGPTLKTFEEQIRKETKVIFLETPSNPFLSVYPLAEISRLASSRGITTIVDNTVATSVNQRPIELGIDISIQSGTKYLGGFNDLQFGTLVCRDRARRSDILRVAKRLGAALSPDHCYQAERNLKTLALRVQKQNENAVDVANFLCKHPLLEKVYYPGLASHPHHAIAKNQMDGFGGLLSFELKKEEVDVNHFLRRLTVVKPALSFGGLESVVCLPAKTSHRGLTKEARIQMGIQDSLIRLSAGIEYAQDIIQDIDQALNGSAIKQR